MLNIGVNQVNSERGKRGVCGVLNSFETEVIKVKHPTLFCKRQEILKNL